MAASRSHAKTVPFSPIRCVERATIRARMQKHAYAALVLCLGWMSGIAGANEQHDRIVAAELARRYDAALFEAAAKADSAMVRRAAARGAGRLKTPEAVSWLATLAGDDAGPVRRAALFALGQIGDQSAFLQLRSMLANVDSNDLPTALIALGKTKDPRAVAELTGRLSHARNGVRGAASIALFRLGDFSAIPEVMAAVKGERNDEARWRHVYAAWRLMREANQKEQLRPQAEWLDWLEPSLGLQRNYEERVFGLRAVMQLSGGAGLAKLMLKDEDPRMRIEAIRALSADWTPEHAAAVAPLIADEDPLVRRMVVDHVAKEPKQAVESLRLLETKLAPEDKLHLNVAVALAKAGERPKKLYTEEAEWRVGVHFNELPEKAPTTHEGKVAAADVCGEESVPAERANAVLAALMEENDLAIRTTAVSSLGKRAEREKSSTLRMEYANTLAEVARKSPGTESDSTRAAVLSAIVKLKISHPWLREALKDTDAPIRASARKALTDLGEDVPANTQAAFRLLDKDPSALMAAATKLRGARVVLETTRGNIEIMLFPDEAPVHCVNFATLVMKGFYDGKSWHRVVPGFVIQGGCPRGDGWGGPGYVLPDEIGTRPYVRGTVGMPKAGDDTGGCQIFITHIPTPHLDGRYTVYGQMLSGFATLDKIRVDDLITKARFIPAKRNDPR